ncbi:MULTISPECIES: DUF7530 family protein [Halolamina]|uniref:Uncharacterized protein n=1 Tax=Halolamina pelagica TaxID=699431 RepID=A0A1I5PUQ6_9EURY|nr:MULTISPECIES: hypothetical protein [Halolamina]NHX34953.1 hypothetical protein [Halolamina sp. R1-12]SFP37647.1 hypothetical protein SAMN05216277_103109 [Halolamina pelagica]
MAPQYGETWVYESLIGAVPGLDLSDRAALVTQFVVFEAIVLVVAGVYDRWTAVPAATAAIAVAVAGSWLMLTFSRTVRQLQPPEGYRRLLFGSSIELALSVLAFVLFVTYLFVVDPGDGGSLLTDLLGSEPPVVAVVLLLLISWDVIYRIGACWWATVVGFWRAIRYGFDAGTTRKLTRLDTLNVLFAGVQVMLVPFVLDHPVLVAAVVGHLVAVVVVAVATVVLQRRAVVESR